MVSCTNPAIVDNGLSGGSGNEFGDTVNYICLSGFFISSGDSSLTCGADGSWVSNLSIKVDIVPIVVVYNITVGEETHQIYCFKPSATYMMFNMFESLVDSD